MSNLSKVLLQSTLAFVVAGSIYSGDLNNLENKFDELLAPPKQVIELNKRDNSGKDLSGIFNNNPNSNIPVTDGDTQISFLPLGGDDVTLITSGHLVTLINTGSPENSEELIDTLHNMGITSINNLIITFPTDANTGGASDLLTNFEVNNIYCPPAQNSSQTYKKFTSYMTLFNKDFIRAKTGDIIALGSDDAILQFISAEKTTPVNDMAYVIRIEIGKTTILLPGEITKEKQQQIEWLPVDVLKLSRSGSENYNTYKLIAGSKPKYVVTTETPNQSPNEAIKEIVRELRVEMLISNARNIIKLSINDDNIDVGSLDFNSQNILNNDNNNHNNNNENINNNNNNIPNENTQQ